eukprot:CAMPEP_0118680362 /NCGR_PEP_ID=MMETSP0800-20121206/4322_1 /TAXON_ID=210618 ORGANISM="Striatella unipunctata, Strain CCMP2910" /NCGR_SAMPLE_ID=MMETSP0800 /ASSEMBLY_ACC=CAM_ASM_000638 /LENGTH=94 /DNA_ID=CAMNT_0006576501 /DNA_START=61 /DNA_END=345 /DNA_ORIENTATION=+
MSKRALQLETWKRSGVTFEESQAVIASSLDPSIYERIGKEEGLETLSRLFYNRVFEDKKEAWFLNIFASSTREEAIDNQYRFFVQTFGGPALYR